MAILTGYKPTKMALLELKNKLQRAKKGHKLLKDKQEGLMKAFMDIIREVQKLRKEVEKELGLVFQNLLLASAVIPHPEYLETALLAPTTKVELDIETKNVMSVKLADIKADIVGDVLSYGFTETSGELDTALTSLREILPLLIQLAETEKKAERMADELEKTRRRVNALEHVMIPNVEDTIKFISQNLEERDRSERIVSMIVKAKNEA
ncbi:V-type ATP synthase subunit D [Candidatus Peregrinibacteria bacterium]|jgi:V/A-type H+/Na+-transporting ATPase subunit D|nr:V-type ATP synthase subunit D [Candidatus Peregrinibacteria bacterium]MBT7484001.1 V-type ATP synthase subunit D [Candidatus Peregrinibacteria bacterium]MBT7703072.1 V-type ATP synthase subunit D [Candidatus Peregrinibacteria bacterium]